MSVKLVSEADNFKFKARYQRALKQFSVRLPLKYFETMKKSLHEKFKNKINFVRPLYRRQLEQVSNKIITLDNDRALKLRGDDFDVKTVLSGANIINVKSKVCKEYKVTLPGACVSGNNAIKDRHITNVLHGVHTTKERLSIDNSAVNKNRSMEGNNIEEFGTKIVLHKAPDTWLRVYPAPKLMDETTSSLVVRCMACQLGLTSFLILWTLIGVFVIQSFEGPHESKMSTDFEREQNQLVIDLATELRQITPLSPKWKYAIERRIEDARQLTIAAVGQGAKLKPGQFWNLSGTFLFAVYVMTALGFGAPVPHTVWGRTCALIYAILAVPTHIYLMVNATTCMVAKVEAYTQYLRSKWKGTPVNLHKSEHLNKESPNCSRHSEASKPENRKIRKLVTTCLGRFYVGHGVPLIILLYYLIGAVAFGIARDKDAMESLLFPLQFTTTGGLEQIEGYVRFLYGLYIEGAMCLLAYTLATIRHYGSRNIAEIANNYRLLVTDKCDLCDNATVHN
ncbi:unnamed protein product [Leptosia nina]|uniref:Potassium channel domain-containing protein n=1 Tax=Leptosia nina TaxID=320188 RepID=A0AAV1J2N7_9NEOP